MVTVLTLAQLCAAAYDDAPQSPLPDWSLCGTKQYGSFFGAAFKGPNGVLVIVYRGSDDAGDWLGSNYNIGAAIPPDQSNTASDFYCEQLDRYKTDRVIVTGHSLGGYLAKVVAGLHPVLAISFNAPNLKGTTHVLIRKTRPKILSIASSLDVVSEFGESYVVPEIVNAPVNSLASDIVAISDGATTGWRVGSIAGAVSGGLANFMLHRHRIGTLISFMKGVGRYTGKDVADLYAESSG